MDHFQDQKTARPPQSWAGGRAGSGMAKPAADQELNRWRREQHKVDSAGQIAGPAEFAIWLCECVMSISNF